MLSSDSDIDSVVTPIEASLYDRHGQVFESDSYSEAFSQDMMDRNYNKHQDRQKTKSRQLHQLDSYSEVQNLTQDDMQEIYQELQAISQKLKEENHLLHERELKVKERERMISITRSNIQTITDHEVKNKWQRLEQKHQEEIVRLEQALKEKTKENKRLKENFETLKQANDSCKKELEELYAQYSKLEKHANGAQNRLKNLQRKYEYDSRQREVTAFESSLEGMSKPNKPHKDVDRPKSRPVVKGQGSVLDTLAVLLDWVCDAHLRQMVTDQPTKPLDRYSSPEYLQEKILRVLPSLVDIIKEIPPGSTKFSLPCLQFIYWSLINIEQGHALQKNSLSSTLRRLGEDVFRSRSLSCVEVDKDHTPPGKGDKAKDGMFFRSSNLHVRLLSSLIILKTLSQADLLAQVFDVLKVDMKSDVAKELFLFYQATPVISHYLKPVNKAFMAPAVDILLQMAADSPFTQGFLESCSNEKWFRTIAMILRTPVSDNKIFERLSVLLQKLSKIKTNKKYFEVYTIVSIIQEMLLHSGNEMAFLSLNLKSIVFNLNSLEKS
ncbi:coiled-coil domain-containing protein 138-like isoform X2 [Gigantopelta aegis]|uniref:coiled-coil domain-containing protein 138-like isoform X2 n=1 Tax=Gigantopelta aegis TaxID=1735272 RepID=UPI001B88C17A|nr:coiled-coil domain-containing protein 138-like isoform X2 [Gigantopelta aegis]